MKKNRVAVIFCSSLLLIVGMGLILSPKVAGANIPSWGVTVGQEIRWDTSLTMSATISPNLQSWIKEEVPSYDLSQILQAINFDHEIKVTITSITDLYDYLGSTYFGPNIEPGVGDLVNASIVARPSGTTAWGNPGNIIADYFSAGMAILNTYYALLGYSVMPQYAIDYLCGNITSWNYTNLPISAWMKLSGLPPMPVYMESMPLSYLPAMMLGRFSPDFLIMPKGIDFRSLNTYWNELASMYYPQYSVSNFITQYGGTVEVNERDAQISWGSTQFMRYAIETYGDAPWNPYAENSKADLGAYVSYDANGLLSAAVLYADISATFNVDLTSYGGPNLTGESFTLTAEIKIGQPDVTFPSKSDLYITAPIANFLISMIGLCVIGGVSLVSIIFSRRRA